jgi:Uma2 family endonuclease
VEVHSKYDRLIEDERKIQRYLAAGTSLIWHVNPKTQIVTVHQPGREPQRFTIGETLSGEDVLPGFDLPVSAIFE